MASFATDLVWVFAIEEFVLAQGKGKARGGDMRVRSMEFWSEL